VAERQWHVPRMCAKIFCVLLSKDTITHLRVQLGPQAAKINFGKLCHINWCSHHVLLSCLTLVFLP